MLALTFDFTPDVLGLLPFLLLSPLVYIGGLLCYTAATTGAAVVAKKLLIGRYQQLREPVWGAFYVRNWMVQQTVRLIPWRHFDGTMFQSML